MTTPTIEEQLPKGFRILSPAWLVTNPLPADALFNSHFIPTGWWPSSRQGTLADWRDVRDGIFASATDLPAEAWADSRPTAQDSYDVHLKEARAALAAMTEERDELKAWKESAMSVDPPTQEIGRALGLTLGASIHDKILPGIQKLQAEVETLKLQKRPFSDKLAQEVIDGQVKQITELETKCSRLTAELDAARKERDALLNANDKENERLNALVSRHEKVLSSWQARNVDLERAIQEAPHEPGCNYDEFEGVIYPCNCWKSRISPKAEQKPATLGPVQYDLNHPVIHSATPSPNHGKAGEWLPIESAPKDGTLIQLCWQSMDGPRFDHAKWNGEHWVSNQINRWTGLPYICREPSKWQPLPAPPTTKSEEGV